MFDWLYVGVSEVLLLWHRFLGWILGGGSSVEGLRWFLAIAALVATARVVLFPLHVLQARYRARMNAVRPRVAGLQAELVDDREELRRQLLVLYRDNKVNPLVASGVVSFVIHAVWIAALSVVFNDVARQGSAVVGRYGWSADEIRSVNAADWLGAPMTTSILGVDGGDDLTSHLVVGMAILLTAALVWSTRRRHADNRPRPRPTRILIFAIGASLLVAALFAPLAVIVYFALYRILRLAERPLPARIPR